jgi:hypothetical protein
MCQSLFKYLTIINIIKLKTQILLTYFIELLLIGCTNPPSKRTKIHFNNSNQKFMPKEDGIKDFRIEQFIYFGDQANMPYGNYSETNQTGFLKELILKSGK